MTDTKEYWVIIPFSEKKDAIKVSEKVGFCNIVVEKSTEEYLQEETQRVG